MEWTEHDSYPIGLGSVTLWMSEVKSKKRLFANKMNPKKTFIIEFFITGVTEELCLAEIRRRTYDELWGKDKVETLYKGKDILSALKIYNETPPLPVSPEDPKISKLILLLTDYTQNGN